MRPGGRSLRVVDEEFTTLEEEENRRRQKTTNRGNKNSLIGFPGWCLGVSPLSSMVFDHLFSLLHLHRHRQLQPSVDHHQIHNEGYKSGI